MRQKSAEMLGLEAVADLAARCGIGADRRTVARALEVVEIDGVSAPTRRGEPWLIPQKAMLEVLTVLLWRRASRNRALQGLPAGPLGDHRLEAARRMLDHDDLRSLVPRKMAEAVRRADREAAERREAELAWLAQLEREERERVEREDRERRAREAAEGRRFWERIKLEREELALRRLYVWCTEFARVDARAVLGPRFWEHPEWRRDWPADRPEGWLPPPEMRETWEKSNPMHDLPFDHLGEAWRPFVPTYVPGRPWLWWTSAK